MSPAWDLAPWLQAAAAVIQGGAAVVIVRLTRRLTTATEEYVRLTRDVAEAARAQAEAARAQLEAYAAQRSADYGRLAALVERIRDQVARLPGGIDAAGSPRRGNEWSNQDVEVLLRVDLWTDQDLDDLADLAAKESHSFKASAAIEHLRWLGQQGREIQSAGHSMPETIWQMGFPWEEWTRHLSGVRTALDHLHAAVEASFETRASLGTIVDRMRGGIPSMIPLPPGSG